MKTVLVTGSAGLVGSEAVRYFCRRGDFVVGLDNNKRRYFFGPEGDTRWNRRRLSAEFPNYRHCHADIRNVKTVERLFREHRFELIIHAAAQPSHDWAAKEPLTDFTINANGTLVLLESYRRLCPEAVFIFTSTNKVYGDRPNTLPLLDMASRFELPDDHRYFRGIDESMSIDACRHSLFGASKVAADMLVQEYGRYFGLKTGVFRGGCLTGPAHSGARLHGFLSYLMRCCVCGEKYVICGYGGKQVRDNIHSQDLIRAFDHFARSPRSGEVYNIGGGRANSVSVLEAIRLCETLSGQSLNVRYDPTPRIGDHMWWISDLSKFQDHYPEWRQTYTVEETLGEILTTQRQLLLKN
jgi:CDP-paratose 2-epimerase